MNFYLEQFDLISSPVSRFCTGAKSGLIEINNCKDCGLVCDCCLGLIYYGYMKPLDCVSSVPLATKYKISERIRKMALTAQTIGAL